MHGALKSYVCCWIYKFATNPSRILLTIKDKASKQRAGRISVQMFNRLAEMRFKPLLHTRVILTLRNKPAKRTKDV